MSKKRKRTWGRDRLSEGWSTSDIQRSRPQVLFRLLLFPASAGQQLLCPRGDLLLSLLLRSRSLDLLFSERKGRDDSKRSWPTGTSFGASRPLTVGSCSFFLWEPLLKGQERRGHKKKEPTVRRTQTSFPAGVFLAYLLWKTTAGALEGEEVWQEKSRRRDPAVRRQRGPFLGWLRPPAPAVFNSDCLLSITSMISYKEEVM